MRLSPLGIHSQRVIMKPIGYIILVLILAVLVYASREQMTVTVTDDPPRVMQPVGLPMPDMGVPPPMTMSQPDPVPPSTTQLPPSLPSSPPDFPAIDSPSVPKATESSELAIARANLKSAEQVYNEADQVFSGAYNRHNANPTMESGEAYNTAHNAKEEAGTQMRMAWSEVERLTG